MRTRTVFFLILFSTLVLQLAFGLHLIVVDVISDSGNPSTLRGATDGTSERFEDRTITCPSPEQTKNIEGGGQGENQFSRLASADYGSFTRHLMCKDYYYNYTPIEPTTIFTPNDDKAVCLITVQARPPDTIDYRWYYRNDSSKAWTLCYNWSYGVLFNASQFIAGYLNIKGYWPGLNYPRAYKAEVYYSNSTLLFSDYFEVTSGGLNSPRVCDNIDVNGYPVNAKSRFTIGVDSVARYCLRFDKIAYFDEMLGLCHNFTSVWIQPDGTIYKTHSGSFGDYKDQNLTWNYWKYGYVSDDNISINSSTPVGNWKVELYLDSYLNETSMPYGPVATTPFIVGNVTVADWTFMAYLDADNTIESAGIDVFLKMANVSLSSRVNVVAQMDRIGDDARYGNWTDCRRFNVTKGMTPTPENAIMNLTEADMGDPDTLRDFVNWAINNYPANYYFLALWDHGAGFTGICFDVTNGSYLSLPDISQALSGLPAIVDVVFVDACSMSMAEVAYQIKDCANVLVGPEGLGWAPAPYDNYLTSLTSNSSASPRDYSAQVVNDYINWCWSIDASQIPNATMAATDLTRITDLAAAIDDFATILKEKETPYHQQISLARNKTRNYEGPFASNFSFYFDLFNLAQLTHQYVPDEEVRNAADEIMVALSIGNTIITEGDKADRDSHGLSIFFPDEKAKYDYCRNWYEKTAFAIDTSWNEFASYDVYGYVWKFQATYSGIPVNINETLYTTDAKGEITLFVLPDDSYTINLTTPVSVGPDSRMVFVHWNDSDTENPRTFPASSLLNAEYHIQYRLIMNASLGTTDPPVGENWCDNSSEVAICAYSPSLSYQSDQEQYNCTWVGTGNGSSSAAGNSSITMRGPINETVTWIHKYLLTVENASYGSTTPINKTMTEAGTSVNVSVASPAPGSNEGTRHVCTGWVGAGSVPASGTSTAVNFTLDKPSSIEWNWKTQYLLTVHTDPAGLNPQPDLSPSGSWYDYGTLVNCTAQEISGYVFDHWIVGGTNWDVGVNPVTVTVDKSYEASAHYEHAQTWWGLLARPDVLQALLAIVGTVVTVTLIGTAWIRNRRSRNIVRAFSDEIDEVYSSHKMDPQKCEEELRALRNTILEGLTDGKITEETYNVLDKKIDKYMAELKKQKKTRADK